ncbi:MAG TPA: hypothetical protein K8V56_10685 [Sporosarcina psychrophila]|uniref:Uncharacterized protein n=1 Tax=Sporosarcina psychrophila TaxID=1476 RepID=A0A921G1M4_SPOPS|nr:hypothetical protein [Sporosarcina psychrophila]
MNYLTSHQMLNDTFRSLSKKVLINSKPQDAIVTTAYLGAVEKRHISSLESFYQGDYVEHEGRTFLVTEEVETRRHNKFRATMTHCNYYFTASNPPIKVDTGLKDDFGKPIYSYTEVDSTYLYCVVSEIERSIVTTGGMSLAKATFFIDIQESVSNKKLFAVNSEHVFKGKNVKVIGQDINQNGRLGIEMQIGLDSPT